MVLLPYQQKWIKDNAAVKIFVKSRRIGISWTEALNSVLHAAGTNGRSTMYISYNREMTRVFISDCAFWARSLSIATSDIKETLLEDEDKDILAYEIRFASGKIIKALSGKPNNIRGKAGRVVVDEAAFCDNLPELLKASIALLMWQGQVSLISTQNGIDNPFNQLVEQIQRGELNYSLHRTTLDDALADGLYKRICLVQGKVWTPQAQNEWRTQLYKDYGIAASEELDCLPFSAQAGKVFDRTWFEIVDTVPAGGQIVRFFDLAATSADLKKDAFFTAGVKMKKVNGIYYIMDAIAEQVSPAAADELIVTTARSDTPNVQVRWELEGGSAGKRDEVHLRSLLSGFDAHAVKPLGDKVKRAAPLASETKRGNVKLLRGDWNERYLNAIHAFDGTSKPLTNDFADSSSGAYNELNKTVKKQPPSVSYATW